MVSLGVYTNKNPFFYVALILSLIGMIRPSSFKPLAFLWFGFAHIAGTITSKVLLSLVFFLLVTPIKYVIKIFGIDSMRLKSWQNQESSSFLERNHLFTKADIEKPY